MESKEYWNKKIIEWEKSSYQGYSKNLSFIERIATKFRSSIKKRREILLDILKDKVKDKTVLELGCGSGNLCFMFLGWGAAKVIGIDIAEKAIRCAKEKAINLGVQNRTDFFIADIRTNIILPDADFVVGLGFIDYIDINTLKRLFAGIKKEFIFSFPEKRFDLISILHYMYLKSQRCPAFYKFSRREFANIPNIQARCHFFTKDHMTFITNSSSFIS